MYTFNGTGTTLYGQRDRAADGSYTATKWLVFLYLPVWPLGTYRVWDGPTESQFLGSRSEHAMRRVAWHRRQIVLTYALTLGLGPFIALLLLNAAIMLLWPLLGNPW